VAEGQTGLAIKPQAAGQSILRLLILDESTSAAQSLIAPLRDMGYAVTANWVSSPLEFHAAIKKQEWDLVIASSTPVNFIAKQALALLTNSKMDLPMIMVSDEIKDEQLSEALNGGARALLKRGQIQHLQLTVQRELRDLAQRRARRYYEKMFRESVRRCQILLESSSHAIVCMRNGKILYSNPAYDRLIEKNKLDSKNISGLIHPDDRQRFEILLNSIESGANLSNKTELTILDENNKPMTAKIEAMVAHVNEQQCAQISISFFADSNIAVNTASQRDSAEPRIHTSGQKDGRSPAIAVANTDTAQAKPVNAELLQKIRRALSENLFRLVYQPIVPLRAQPAENYEALIRMVGDDGEEIPPAKFMPTAENAGCMKAIDRWVIRAAMQTLVKQHSRNKHPSLLVKLSEDSIGDRTLVPWIGEMLQEYHLPGDTVIFEIKEAHIKPRLKESVQLIYGLKQLHCRTALGHFGSDPHSLDCLDQVRADFVKLAGIFVDNISDDPKSQAMVKAVVQTAHDLGTQTIATFVQDASKMAKLWQCNVDYIQGYFLQAPEQELSYNFSDEE
jgi:EAL domain-containing protein (putative c-di-GMP-specific phosphodiesterase class I)/PAS domain-containing protein